MNDKEQISGSSNIYDLMVKNLMSPKVEGGSGLSAEEATKIAVRALQKLKGESADIELAFDVGHSSLGWAVLQTTPNSQASTLNLLGCGVVTFGADDCLASKRRLFRRQRRHARATRQRIERLEKLLAHLGVMGAEQLKSKHTQAGGHSAPWLLAARVLASNGDAKHLLTWPELWDVLRWYAHNRGYDGNKRWSAAEADSEAAKEDSEKEQNARSLMEKFATTTMAETFCQHLNLDPLGAKQASAIRFKGLNAAFPREGVEAEVRRVLQAHFGKLPKVDSQFEQALFDNWQAIPCPDIKLPKRFQGGLLFGQLVPRFDNRIISKCPVTGQKVPSRNCPEFFRFRWAMQLANIRVGKMGDRDLRPLTAEERTKLDILMRAQGSLTPGELKKAVRDLTGSARDNLDTMLMHPDAKDALLLDPAQKLVTSDKLKTLWPLLPARIQKRARGQWRRSKMLTLEKLRAQAVQLGESVDAFDAEVQRLLDSGNTKKSRKQGQLTRESLLKEPLKIERLSGRAAFARHLLQQAHVEVMAGKHPKEEGGCLFVTEQMRAKQLLRSLDDQTNNHLVRHRLLILQRLLRDLVADPAFANGDKSRVTQVTIEVNRDLREMSGMTNYQKEAEMREKLKDFKSVVAYLEDRLPPQYHDKINANVIRKARVASDLDWHCPYTGTQIQPIHLVTGIVDLDHIIPYAERPSNSLDSLVVTFSVINRMKAKRSAFQFVKEEAQRAGQFTDETGTHRVDGFPDIHIRPFKEFEQFVKDLDQRKGHDDDKRRKKKRKELLLLPRYEEKGFTPRDLTVTSQLVRLGAQVIQGFFTGSAGGPPADSGGPPESSSIQLKSGERVSGGPPDTARGPRALPRIISLPGAVTGAVRKGWRVLGCLAQAAPQILDEHGDTKTKTDIRSLTHLHHALDACVLALAAHHFPNNGSLWEAMVVRSPSIHQKQLLHATGFYEFDQHDKPQFKELPAELKNQIAARLAEKRVVQHIPADMSGMKAEENTRGVVKVENGRVYLRQRTRDDKTGKLSVKETDEVIGKVVGLTPQKGQGKLTPMKGVRVIADNFGVAILDHATNPDDKFVIIPWHKVWHRLGELKQKNGGKRPRVLRIGNVIRVPNTPGKNRFAGMWMVRGVTLDQRAGYLIDISSPDVIEYRVPGRKDCKRNISLKSLVEGGLEVLKPSLCGVAQTQSLCPTTSSA